MPIQSAATLKSYFNTGDTPTQSNFEDLIDTIFDSLVLASLTLISSSNDISNPPTQAEITAAFGLPATVGIGKIFLLMDTGSTNNVYLCICDGVGWQFTSLTKAV